MDGAECIGGLFAVFVYFYCKCICVWVELSVSEGSLLSLLSCAKAKLLLRPKGFQNLFHSKSEASLTLEPEQAWQQMIMSLQDRW